MQHKIKVVEYEGLSCQSYMTWQFNAEDVRDWVIHNDNLFITSKSGNCITIPIKNIVRVDNISFEMIDSFLRVPKVVEALNKYILEDIRNALLKAIKLG